MVCLSPCSQPHKTLWILQANSGKSIPATLVALGYKIPCKVPNKSGEYLPNNRNSNTYLTLLALETRTYRYLIVICNLIWLEVDL